VNRSVLIGPRAAEDLAAIAEWIEAAAGPDIANAYLNRLQAACAELSNFPSRGTPRDDLASGVRTIPFGRRATIAYRVTADTITILRILHRGRDLGAAFQS